MLGDKNALRGTTYLSTPQEKLPLGYLENTISLPRGIFLEKRMLEVRLTKRRSREQSRANETEM